jgi:hypothetical protein
MHGHLYDKFHQIRSIFEYTDNIQKLSSFIQIDTIEFQIL